MFENRRKNYRRTVREDVSNENWLGCSELVGKSGVHCLGFIRGTNRFGEFTALVADDGNNYYIPKWMNESFMPDNFTDEELDYLMSGEEITVTKREYQIGDKKKQKQFTYDIKIGKYDM